MTTHQRHDGERILCVKWHPIFDYIFAAGSFSNEVQVWDTQNQGAKSLKFHTDRVRSLSWNYELPWMLITAADDANICIWDIRNETLLTSVYQASLSLTSFAVHPDHPFSIISTHFDNSIIQWSLLGIPDIAIAQTKMLLDLPITETLCDPHDSMLKKFSSRLSGA